MNKIKLMSRNINAVIVTYTTCMFLGKLISPPNFIDYETCLRYFINNSAIMFHSLYYINSNENINAV